MMAASITVAPTAAANPSPAYSPIYFPSSGSASVTFNLPIGSSVSAVEWIDDAGLTDPVCDSGATCRDVRHESPIRPAGTIGDLVFHRIGQEPLLLSDWRDFDHAPLSDIESDYHGPGFVVSVTTTKPPVQPELSVPVPETAEPTPGSSAPKTRSVTSPDIKVVGYIASFDVWQCIKDLQRAFVRAGAVLCGLLDRTANPVPPDSIASSDRSWADFLATREHRPVVHLPGHTMQCSDGKPTGPPTADIPAWRSFGYTPIFRWYADGDPYADPHYSSDPPATSYDVVAATGTVDYRVAARASNFESVANVGATNDVLPFVWIAVRETLTCDGSSSVQVFSSNTPTTKVYRDGRLVHTKHQTSDWAAFLTEASRWPDPRRARPGHGVLDPHCSRIEFSGLPSGPTPVDVPMTMADCRSFTPG